MAEQMTPRAFHQPAPTLPIQSRRAAPMPPVQDHDYLDLPPSDFHHGDTPPTPIDAHPAQEAMVVQLAGVERRAAAWSKAGVALDAPLSNVAAGRVHDLRVVIGSGATRLQLDLLGLAEARPGASVTRFAFVELERPQARLLHRLGDEGMPLEQLLAETRVAPAAPMPAAQTPAAPAPAMAPAPAPKAKPRRKRSFGIGRLHLVVGLAALTFAGGALWNNGAVIPARYAVISAGDTAVTATLTGQLAALDITPGQSVLRGQVLGRITPAGAMLSPEALDRQSGMQDELAVLQARRDGMADPAAEPALSQAIAERMAYLEGELAQLAAGASGPGEAILSPCDCTVQSVSIPAGGRVEAGQPLAELTGGSGAGVQALIRETEAARIDAGDRARILLSDGTRVDGTVTGLARNRDAVGFEGLGETIFAAERYARLDIAPDQPLAVTPGTAVSLSVQTSAILGFVQEQSRAAFGALLEKLGL